jgi:2-polyprenyl-6-methoxyphenol hydroxylase-like FAD-dependent oxidoreductase
MDGPVRILGGGIGGLTAALALHQHGIDCEVHERAPELAEIGAGLGLWPNALRVFDRLGIGDKVRSLSGSWETAGLRRADGRYLMHYGADEMAARLGEPTIGVHRGELQALLVNELPDGILHLGQESAAVEDEAGGPVRVRFVDGTVLDAAAVIGADGRRSRVRAELFGERPLHQLKAVGWRGTTHEPEGAGWGRKVGETWSGKERFGILPISGGRVTWYAAAPSFLGDGGRDELLSRFGHLHDPIPALIEATPEESIWRDQIDDLFPMRRWVQGRVALLGDAAHPMTPDLGQGACHAILDAWAIATALAERGDPAVAFQRYQRARRRSAARMVMIARTASTTAGSGGRVGSALAEAVVARVPRRLALRGLSRVVAG